MNSSRGDLLPAEVALDEGVVGGGDRLDELLRVAGHFSGQFRRHRDTLVVPLGPPLILVAVAGEEVHDPVEPLAVAHGDLDRDDPRGEVGLDPGVDPVEVGVLLVHRGDDEDPGEVEGVAHLPDPLGPDLDPGGGGEDHQRRVGDREGARGLADVFEVAGVSRRLMRTPFHSAKARPSPMLCLASISSGVVSVRAVPSRTEPWRRLEPLT